MQRVRVWIVNLVLTQIILFKFHILRRALHLSTLSIILLIILWHSLHYHFIFLDLTFKDLKYLLRDDKSEVDLLACLIYLMLENELKQIEVRDQVQHRRVPAEVHRK